MLMSRLTEPLPDDPLVNVRAWARFCRADQGMIALCSPNMDFIPRIVQGDVSLTLMSDGRFGILDPILWPQIHSDQYAYLAAVRKTVPCHHRAAAMWLDPTPDDFQELTGTPVRGLGFFAPTYVGHLDQLVQSILGEVRLLQFSTPGTSHGHASVAWHELCMRQALSRLQVIPATFRDQSIQVRVLQRHWIMTEAFLEFNRLLQDDERACAPLPLQADMMGAWTTNPQVVHQYIRLGLPVWFLRRDLHAPLASESPIPSSLEPVSPSHICSEPLVPGCVLYHGLAGDGHLRQTIRRAHPYLDISPNVTVSNPVASSAIPPAPLPTRQVRKEYAARAALLGLRSQPAESAPFSPNPSGESAGPPFTMSQYQRQLSPIGLSQIPVHLPLYLPVIYRPPRPLPNQSKRVGRPARALAGPGLVPLGETSLGVIHTPGCRTLFRLGSTLWRRRAPFRLGRIAPSLGDTGFPSPPCSWDLANRIVSRGTC